MAQPPHCTTVPETGHASACQSSPPLLTPRLTQSSRLKGRFFKDKVQIFTLQTIRHKWFARLGHPSVWARAPSGRVLWTSFSCLPNSSLMLECKAVSGNLDLVLGFWPAYFETIKNPETQQKAQTTRWYLLWIWCLRLLLQIHSNHFRPILDHVFQVLSLSDSLPRNVSKVSATNCNICAKTSSRHFPDLSFDCFCRILSPKTLQNATFWALTHLFSDVADPQTQEESSWLHSESHCPRFCYTTRQNDYINNLKRVILCNGRDLLTWNFCSQTENCVPQNVSM